MLVFRKFNYNGDILTNGSTDVRSSLTISVKTKAKENAGKNENFVVFDYTMKTRADNKEIVHIEASVIIKSKEISDNDINKKYDMFCQQVGKISDAMNLNRFPIPPFNAAISY